MNPLIKKQVNKTKEINKHRPEEEDKKNFREYLNPNSCKRQFMGNAPCPARYTTQDQAAALK
jgi:hypothetical protein